MDIHIYILFALCLKHELQFIINTVHPIMNMHNLQGDKVDCYKAKMDTPTFHNENWFVGIQIARSERWDTNWFNLRNAKNNILPLRHHGTLRDWSLNTFFPRSVYHHNTCQVCSWSLYLNIRILAVLVTYARGWQLWLQIDDHENNEMITEFPRMQCVWVCMCIGDGL